VELEVLDGLGSKPVLPPHQTIDTSPGIELKHPAVLISPELELLKPVRGLTARHPSFVKKLNYTALLRESFPFRQFVFPEAVYLPDLTFNGPFAVVIYGDSLDETVWLAVIGQDLQARLVVELHLFPSRGQGIERALRQEQLRAVRGR